MVKGSSQTIVTGVGHSPHGSHHSPFTAASPSTNSPTGSNTLTNLVVAQVFFLLSNIKEDKDRTKWEQQAEQLKKLIDANGMEVFQKYFSRLVVGNAYQIFPGVNRQITTPGNYSILVMEIRKISQDVEQARKIAESIEMANEDIFRDFDLSTFMDHFKLDALEKTILALAFKSGSKSDLKAKADAIISNNYSQFLQFLARKNNDESFGPDFVATIVDRLIQTNPPCLDQKARNELVLAVQFRYDTRDFEHTPPTAVLASLYLLRILSDQKSLAFYMCGTGAAFTKDNDTCSEYLQNCSHLLTEDNVSTALIYSIISTTHKFSPEIFVKSLRREVPATFDWSQVISHFDQQDLRITQQQFLNLYKAVQPLALEEIIDIQRLWGGKWCHTETQLSFITAYASLNPSELDATTIPRLQKTFTIKEYSDSPPLVQKRAAYAVTDPLISVAALEALFHVALHETAASETPEAKRLFARVVLPKLDIFMVSAFGVPKPWPALANDTLFGLFDRYLTQADPHRDFVLESLWRKDCGWVAQRLVDAHAKTPLRLPVILDHAFRHKWLNDLTSMHNGFGLDLAAIAHARGLLNLDEWRRNVTGIRIPEFAQSLKKFLDIKASHELSFQRTGELSSVMLPVKTVAALLNLLEEIIPKSPAHDWIAVQRRCITAYPRLINYNEGFNDIIDANGAEANFLPAAANEKMEEHYKRMYSDDLQVRNVVDALEGYKRSRDPADQDVFACMIHGLFDEFALYGTYPLEALATTAVLFGGIISRRLIENLPLEIGLGMILEAVRDHAPGESMYKFGLQALMQLLSRLCEWPGFCVKLLQIPYLQGTEAWKKAEEVVHSHQEEEVTQSYQINGDRIGNRNVNEMISGEPSIPPFSSLHVDPSPHTYEDPDGTTQDRILFVLNNMTADNLETKFVELNSIVEDQNHQWFADHLVAHRAKTEPNFHKLYLSLLKLFGRKSLWAETLRETYICAFHSLNSEATLSPNGSTERAQLKNLASWLGSLTLARDKPIKHTNIAFKQLLTEAYQTNRLLIVIPFVCKVLGQGKESTVFKPPNPWVMDVVRALRELYLGADLKLNLKFEIEVLFGELSIDPKTIEPSNEIMNRLISVDETAESLMGLTTAERFENLSPNDISGVSGARFSPQEITSSIPDLGPMLVYPPANEMVNQARLQDIVRTATTRAVYEIISPVVERSVTIAAISTAQMIKKDFATEPNEAKVRNAAILMVKKTAGSLALVTSKEPLRASMTNYIRALSGDLPQGLPEGTIIMCVNSNLDLACSQVEKKAEERAIPEIEEIIEPELEARRVHRMTRPDSPYVDVSLSRWALTIPNPFRLQPSMNGLNQDQIAIYDDFARPRLSPTLAGTTQAGSTSDATRSMTSEVLQEQYPTISTISNTAETPALPQLNNQPQPYLQSNPVLTNGRITSLFPDPRILIERVQKTLIELERLVIEASEEHYTDLIRPHPVIDILDVLYNLILRTSQSPDALDIFIVDQICNILFGGTDHSLMIESLVHVLENICRIGGRTASRVALMIAHQPAENFWRVPLTISLIKTEMIDWHRIDSETSKAIIQRREEPLKFLSSLVDAVLLHDRPIALFSDLASSLEAAWKWTDENPSLEIGQKLKHKLIASGMTKDIDRNIGDSQNFRRDQMEYVFEEWVHLCNNSNASDQAVVQFITQMYNKQLINNRDDLCIFLRLSIDISVDRFEQQVTSNGNTNGAYVSIDSLAKLIIMLIIRREEEWEVQADKAAYLKTVLSLLVLVLNHHHVMRGENFNQKVFYRLFASLISEFNIWSSKIPAREFQKIMLVLPKIFLDIRPSYFPGFLFAYLSLLSHRSFLPVIMGLPNSISWEPIAEIIVNLLSYVGELLKSLHISPVSKEIYRGVLKLILIFYHDFPGFLAAYHTRLCTNIPNHCTQLRNIILSASPIIKLPDPLQKGLKLDRIEEMRDSPENMDDIEVPIRQVGLLDVINQTLQSGPSEDAIAHIAHAMQGKKNYITGVGFVPINTDLNLISSLIIYICMYSINNSNAKDRPSFSALSPDVALLSMLIHELRPEARYFFLSSIVDQLRYPNSHTYYFMQVVLDLFSKDANDQEELDIRQQVTRIFLERMICQWPQPWGLIVTIHELIKNEKYLFLELPFIKSAPEVCERFTALTIRHI
ncbi:General negative regulator of transcription subunit 1 [Erysiphe necator]|nr:General negative regulator of transcription subunit 1 [Erysiphe necator]